MRANRSYRLLHTRSSRRPASLDPARIDHLEVVDIASGAARRARRLREELASLEVEEFIDRWAE